MRVTVIGQERVIDFDNAEKVAGRSGDHTWAVGHGNIVVSDGELLLRISVPALHDLLKAMYEA